MVFNIYHVFVVLLKKFQKNKNQMKLKKINNNNNQKKKKNTQYNSHIF